jgi:hypothetical protein
MVDNSAPNTPIGYRTRWWLAPALAGIYPVISLYFESLDEAKLIHAIICGAVVSSTAVALAYLFRFIFSDTVRASLAAVAFLAWSFTFSGYMRAGRFTLVTLSPLRDYLLMALWLVVLLIVLGVLYRLRWTRNRMARLNRFIKVACVFAIGFGLIQGVAGRAHSTRRVVESKSIWASDQEAMPSAWKPAATAPQRDVYYLLFDRYANADTLKRFFGFDDSEFYNELEKRGFVVDRKATTSYPMTAPSMASTLNMRYLGPQFGDVSDYFSSMDANEVGKLFIQAGYTYYYFGNEYDPLRRSSIAQWNMKISMLPWEFADSLVNMTPLRMLIGREYKRKFIADKFAKVADLAKNLKPTFTYAHFLVPHPPYAIARDGSALSEVDRATRPEQELYIEQLIATNRLILELIDDLQSASAVKPIIILHADEGPYLMDGDESLSREEQIAKREGILNAILIPDDAIRQKLTNPPKPVNTFRFLFKEYFGAPISLLPERAFYWETPAPTGAAAPGTQIIDVTRDLLRNAATANSRGA